MRIRGNYVRTLWRDEKTGETVFSIFTKGPGLELSDSTNNVICRGHIPLYPIHMPLALEGEQVKDRSGRWTFMVSSCEESKFSETNAEDFLTSKAFKGIGPKTAERIVAEIGADLFSFAWDDDSVERLMAVKGVTPEAAENMVQVLRKYRSSRELMELMVRYGGTYQDACMLHSVYGQRAQEKIFENPYIMMKHGVKYHVCESFAKELNIPGYDERRLNALLMECFRRREAKGNTCATMAELEKEKCVIEKESNMGYSTDLFFFGAALLRNRKEYISVSSEKGPCFYSKTMYEMEYTAGNTVRSLNSTYRELPVSQEVILEIEKALGIRYGDKQREAFGLLKEAGLSILTGGPGTGKTTVLHGLMQCYKLLMPDEQILLCAPTANAAKKMRESTGLNAVTVHKLLGLVPNEDGQINNVNRKMDCGLLVVDEASMLDIELFSALVKSVRPGTRVLLVGDEDQLESVGPGNVLHDLLLSGSIPSCRLDVIYRQGEESGIVENSIRVREGSGNLLQKDDFEIHEVQTDEELTEVALREYDALRNPRDPWGCRLLTPVRRVKYSFSTWHLNKAIQDKYNPGTAKNGEQKEELTYGGKTFRVGDPVVFLRNNYEAGYINGDEGIVRKCRNEKNGKSLTIQTEEKEIEIEGQMLDDIDLAYAITIHKSQGGECDTCIVVVPSGPANMLRRAMLYVAITRAKRKAVIVATDGALERAIRNEGHTERTTGLKKLLQNGSGIRNG